MHEAVPETVHETEAMHEVSLAVADADGVVIHAESSDVGGPSVAAVGTHVQAYTASVPLAGETHQANVHEEP